jgi:hypothetical protein
MAIWKNFDLNERETPLTNKQIPDCKIKMIDL